eukprot:scaffold76015_cov26-Phaeocystis_antarctica.AAC.2
MVWRDLGHLNIQGPAAGGGKTSADDFSELCTHSQFCRFWPGTSRVSVRKACAVVVCGLRARSALLSNI